MINFEIQKVSTQVHVYMHVFALGLSNGRLPGGPWTLAATYSGWEWLLHR